MNVSSHINLKPLLKCHLSSFIPSIKIPYFTLHYFSHFNPPQKIIRMTYEEHKKYATKIHAHKKSCLRHQVCRFMKKSHRMP